MGLEVKLDAMQQLTILVKSIVIVLFLLLLLLITR